MLLLLVATGLFLAGVRSEERTIPQECRSNLNIHYEEMGCTPGLGSDSCPIKYDCPTRSRDKCHLEGREYEPGAQIGSFFRMCSASCYCQGSPDGANIQCANVECPELFNPSYRSPNCIPQYSIDDCCSESQFCPNETKNATDVTCEYNGSILMQGQKFYPTEEPCKVCVCQQGFNGTLTEPWCKKIMCGTELHYADDFQNGCIPVYYGGCCPATYRCPQDGDQVRQISLEDSVAARTSDEKCTYGSLRMNIGDVLDLGSDKCIECTCRVPPLPVCENKCNS